MRTTKLLAPLAASALALAGCGGSGSASSSTARGSRAAGADIKGPVKIYRLSLSGWAETSHGASAASRSASAASHGASAATGSAIIALHGTSRVCWRFAHLHGFTDPTSARIYKAPKGKSGKPAVSLSKGHRLHHEGCVHASPSVISAIERAPQDYYVNIHSAQYPGGAVRAQL